MDTQTQPQQPIQTPNKRKTLRQLRLPEKLFVLMIEDERGAIAPSAKAILRLGLAGAILAEFVHTGKTQLENGRLSLGDSTPLGTASLAEIFGEMAEEKKPRKVNRWIEILNRKQTVRQVADWLSEDKVLSVEGKKYVWVTPFSGSSHPDASAKYLVKQQLRNIVLGGASPKTDDLILLKLLKACRLLKLVFTRDEYKFATHKVETLTPAGVFSETMVKFLDDFETYVQAAQ